MKTNHLDNPLGFYLGKPVLSYTVSGTDGTHTQCARIQVAAGTTFSVPVFDSGLRSDIDECAFELPFEPQELTRYYWRVYVQADNGDTAWSDVAFFETAKRINAPWKGIFITPVFDTSIRPVFIRHFTLRQQPVRARLYSLALGVYEVYINGQKAGNEYLLPGIHAYDKWLQYQTFEADFRQGENCIEIRTGAGWYKGTYGLTEPKKNEAAEYSCIAEIHITDSTGSVQIIGTDSSWRAVKNQITGDGIYDGETYDASFNDKTEYDVKPGKDNTALLYPRLSPPVTIHERLKPVMIRTPAGEQVLDMQQNMTGWVEFQADLKKGQCVKLEFAEVLQNGNFYRDNLRSAACVFTYISGGFQETVRPHYTFFGFRYVRLTGFPGNIQPADFTGCVIHSDMEKTGSIETANPELNKLVENIRWGLKGNFLDTATDCPQRDERMGWTGDAQIFSDTACYLADTTAFYTKFMHDLAMEQAAHNGSVTYVVPAPRYPFNGAACWGDAAVIIPWTVYIHTGDRRILENQYQSMKDWVDYIRRQDREHGNRYLWTSGHQLGDWLALDGSVSGGVYGATDRFYIASAYYYYSALLLSKAAAVLGRKHDHNKYAGLAERIKRSFEAEYFTTAGRLAVQTQTAYAVAVYMGLVPEKFRERTFRDFRSKMKENGFVLTTGFVGTPYLCPALAASGNTDIAYTQLLNTNYPGWLYEVRMGATTVWERWNSILPDGRISGTAMNSLNHYAYGSILSWIFRDILGLSPDEYRAGFKTARIAPKPDLRLTSVAGSVETPYGTYRISWKIRKNKFTMTVTVPFDADAVVVLPWVRTIPEDLECGPFAADCKDGTVRLQLTAGTCTIAYTMQEHGRQTYSIEDSPEKLMQEPAAKAVILKHFPAFAAKIPWQEESKTMEDVLRSPFVTATEQDMQALEADLAIL